MPAAHTLQPRNFLVNAPLFRELSPDELDRVAAHTRPVRVERGTILFHRGDAVPGFHLIVYGQVKLAFVASNGNEKVVEILGPGQSFGEALMFLERPRVVTATALTDALLLFIGREGVFQELERNPTFARHMLAGLAHRLHHLIADLEATSMRSGTQRVIGYLLRDCPDEPQGNALEVTLPTLKGIVASRLNLTQEHFSRILHDLAAKGLIEVHGRRIDVLDLERLRTYDQ